MRGLLFRTLLIKLYEFEVSADPTWLARRFGDELGVYLEAKLRTNPALNKVESAVVVRLVMRLLKDQANAVGKVAFSHMRLKFEKCRQQQ